MYNNNIKEYHGKVVQESVKCHETINGKLYYEIVVLNIKNENSHYKTFRLYEPKECSYKDKTVFIQYYSKKSDYLKAVPDIEYACLSQKEYYNNYITKILIDEEVKHGIIFLPVHDINFSSFLSGFYSTYYLIEGIQNIKIHKKKMVAYDDVNHHIDYNKDVVYIFDDYYDMVSDKHFMKFLSSCEDKDNCGFLEKNPSFIINDGNLYLGKTLWKQMGNLIQYDKPLTMRHINYILREVKGYQHKKIEYFLSKLKDYHVKISNNNRKAKLDQTDNGMVLFKTEQENQIVKEPFISTLDNFFVKDVNVIATNDNIRSEKVYFSNINSDLVSSFTHHNNDISNQLRILYPDNRMLFVYSVKDKDVKNATPSYIITKKGFFYCYPKGFLKRLKKYIEINQIKKLTSDYVKHLESENSYGYFTKKIFSDSLNSNNKLSKKDKKNQFEKLEKFFKS